MIDIVIPFYNDSDEKWKKVLYDYMEKEGSNDRQVVGEERYRDWNCFKYFFRSVEKNCKWVNKIFLIVASESQIPDWLDTSNSKLRIVLHEDYIPKELLPTFGTFTIELFISRIKDLSDNYVYCNDDYFFLNEVDEYMFFVNDVPVYRSHEAPLEKFGDDYLNGSDGTFYSTLNNNMELQKEYSGDKAKWHAIDHLPVAHKKNFEKEIIDKYYDRFINAHKVSKFRNKENYSNHLFTCLYRDTMPYYKFDCTKGCYISVRNDTEFEEYKNCNMVCFNDTEQLSQDKFEEVRNKMINFLESKFPKKSSFEK